MILSSNDIKDGELLDKRFTCDGEAFSPHLKWRDEPRDTKSFALYCIDPNTKIGIIGHWYICDIPLTIHEILQGAPVSGKIIENDFGNLYFEAPCPEDGTHTYIFEVFALDIENLENVSTLNFRKTIRKHALGSAKITTIYKREFDFTSFRNLKHC